MTLSYPLRLLTAVLAHLLLYVLGTNLAWVLGRPRAGRLGQATAFVRTWGGRLQVGELLRWAFYLAPPYLVLLYGWASPLDLGLADLDWIGGVGYAAALGAGSLALMAMLWWPYRRLAAEGPPMRGVLWLSQPWGWAFVLRDAILFEAWMAWVRSAMLLWAGPYRGVYLGLGAILLAGALNARTRHELRAAGAREDVVLTGSLAVVTATLYVFAHNLWLCLAVHFLLRLAVLTLVRSRRGAT